MASMPSKKLPNTTLMASMMFLSSMLLFTALKHIQNKKQPARKFQVGLEILSSVKTRAISGNSKIFLVRFILSTFLLCILILSSELECKIELIKCGVHIFYFFVNWQHDLNNWKQLETYKRIFIEVYRAGLVWAKVDFLLCRVSPIILKSKFLNNRLFSLIGEKNGFRNTTNGFFGSNSRKQKNQRIAIEEICS